MRRASMFAAIVLAVTGCGGGDENTASSPSGSGAPFAYDVSAPLGLVERNRNRRDGLIEREVSFAVPGGRRVAATLVVGSDGGPRPGVVYLHGAGGHRSDMLPLARRLVRRGAVALSLDWPEPGAAEARLAGIPALEAQGAVVARAVIAVRRALDVLAALPEQVDGDRLGVVGWSGGARIAALTAGAEPRLDAVVLMSAGALPVARYVQAAPPEVQADVRRVLAAVDPLRWLKRARADLLLQNGRSDEVVPRNALETLAAAAPRPRDLRWYDSGHELDGQAYVDQLDWLERRLLARPG